jgi:hexokinase
MAFSSALFTNDEQRVLDDIDRQFRPSLDTLINLTKEFLVEFKLGLENYGQPMAMMQVSIIAHVQDSR